MCPASSHGRGLDIWLQAYDVINITCYNVIKIYYNTWGHPVLGHCGDGVLWLVSVSSSLRAWCQLSRQATERKLERATHTHAAMSNRELHYALHTPGERPDRTARGRPESSLPLSLTRPLPPQPSASTTLNAAHPTKLGAPPTTIFRARVKLFFAHARIYTDSAVSFHTHNPLNSQNNGQENKYSYLALCLFELLSSTSRFLYRGSVLCGFRRQRRMLS